MTVPLSAQRLEKSAFQQRSAAARSLPFEQIAGPKAEARFWSPQAQNLQANCADLQVLRDCSRN
eukprot:7381560-Alexandrium_andersonii.AAC.1